MPRSHGVSSTEVWPYALSSVSRTLSSRVVAIGGVQRVEAGEGPAIEVAGIDEPLRHLVGGRPARVVGHHAGAPAVGATAAAQREHAVGLAQVLRHGPRTVVAQQLD